MARKKYATEAERKEVRRARNRVSGMSPAQLARHRARRRVENLTPEQLEEKRAKARVCNKSVEQLVRAREYVREYSKSAAYLARARKKDQKRRALWSPTQRARRYKMKRLRMERLPDEERREAKKRESEYQHRYYISLTPGQRGFRYARACRRRDERLRTDEDFARRRREKSAKSRETSRSMERSKRFFQTMAALAELKNTQHLKTNETK